MRLGGDKITEWRIKLGMELELSLSLSGKVRFGLKEQ